MVNPAKAKLESGGIVTAFIVTMPSVPVAQLLATSTVDMLVFDMEHGLADVATVHAMIAATQGTNATPLVRVPSFEPWLAKPALDAGAFGLLFPMVNSVQDALATVQAIRYPPTGKRGFAPAYAPTRWGLSTPQYLKVANEELLNVILIETGEAIERLNDILAVPGIDAAVVATFDLSMSLGLPGQRTHPQVLELVALAEQRILASGVPMGGVALAAEEAEAMVDRGYRMFALGYDVPMIQGAAARALEALNKH